MRHRRQGVKREHSVIAEYAAVFERLAALPGVAAVIPGRIAVNPTRHPGLVLKNPTPSGFKLLAKSRTSVQEVFLVCQADHREAVRQALQPLLQSAAAGRRSRPPGNKAGTRRASRGTMRQGRVPETGTGPHRAGRSFGPLAPDARTYRRLYALALRGARWHRRFGVPLRRVRLAPSGHRPRARRRGDRRGHRHPH